jgi:MDMPI C-terminal domain/Mycothiol maleylpyruvate isomerase N-terminal domain
MGSGVWLRAGAARIADAVREAGSDLVWTFTGPAPAVFWIRRMAHETLVHRADAQLAVSAEPEPAIDAGIAADAIDEWLTLLTGGILGNADEPIKALPAGAALHIHATDDGLAGRGEWMIRHDAGGLTVKPGHGKGGAALTGPAASLLLVLMRRKPVSDPAVTVYGDSAVVDGWLASTAF